MESKGLKAALMVPMQGNSKFSPFESGKLEESLSWLEENGIVGVEPIIADPEDVELDDFINGLHKYHLKATTVVTGQPGNSRVNSYSLSTEDEDLRVSSVKCVCSHIRNASEMGAMVTLGLIKGGCIQKSAREKALNQFSRSLSEIVDIAASQKVTLLLEPINHMKSGFLNSSQENADYIRTYFEGAPIKLLWDSYQSDMEDGGSEKSLEEIKDKLAHVHYADTNRLFPGEGEINFESITRKLKDIQYNGFITLESFVGSDHDKFKRKAASFFRHMF